MFSVFMKFSPKAKIWAKHSEAICTVLGGSASNSIYLLLISEAPLPLMGLPKGKSRNSQAQCLATVSSIFYLVLQAFHLMFPVFVKSADSGFE
jgi:hypothetical protein